MEMDVDVQCPHVDLAESVIDTGMPDVDPGEPSVYSATFNVDPKRSCVDVRSSEIDLLVPI